MENSKHLRENNPEKKLSEISKLCGEMWNEFTLKQKAPYNEMAHQDLARY
jgi:hypothetical protein